MIEYCIPGYVTSLYTINYTQDTWILKLAGPGSIIVSRLYGFSHIFSSDFGYNKLFCTVCG